MSKIIFLLIVATAVSSMLIPQQLVSTLQVYASESSPYQSGYDHGCDDAGRSESDKYINQPEKGPSFHTQEFMNGYYAGLNSCGGGERDGEEESTPDERGGGFVPDSSSERYYEGQNWRSICNAVDDFLSESCSDLVTSDGRALTYEGKIALERIKCGGEAIVGALLTENALALLRGLTC